MYHLTQCPAVPPHNHWHLRLLWQRVRIFAKTVLLPLLLHLPDLQNIPDLLPITTPPMIIPPVWEKVVQPRPPTSTCLPHHHFKAQREEATFPLLSPCPPTPFTASAAETYSSTCPWPPCPPTAAKLCCSCSPAYYHSAPQPHYLNGNY